jgi:cell division protein FtsQ
MDILVPGKKRNHRKSGASAKQQRPARNINKGQVWKWLVIVSVGALCVYAGMRTPQFVETVSNQRVEHVIIEGEVNYFSEQEVLGAVDNFISESLLLVDMGEIKKALEKMPWIRTVTIRREWPDTMVLSVAEERAIARWGEGRLLNQDGAIFSPADIVGLEHLAVLSGPEGAENKVMEQYMLFNELLYQRGLKIHELSLGERGGWNLILANGVNINIGKTEVMRRIKRLMDFADPLFIDQMAIIDSIDLRYTSGIAVRNKTTNAEEVVSL